MARKSTAEEMRARAASAVVGTWWADKYEEGRLARRLTERHDRADGSYVILDGGRKRKLLLHTLIRRYEKVEPPAAPRPVTAEPAVAPALRTIVREEIERAIERHTGAAERIALRTMIREECRTAVRMAFGEKEGE